MTKSKEMSLKAKFIIQQVVRRISEKYLAQKSKYKLNAMLKVQGELKKEHFDDPLCANIYLNVCIQ